MGVPDGEERAVAGRLTLARAARRPPSGAPPGLRVAKGTGLQEMWRTRAALLFRFVAMVLPMAPTSTRASPVGRVLARLIDETWKTGLREHWPL